MGSRPAGLLTPASVRAMAEPPSTPGYQASRMALACWLAQFSATAEPLCSTTVSYTHLEHALVAYRLDVIPGPVYHLRSVAIKNLDAPQENRVRELLGMKPGDVFLDEAVNGLYRKIADDPLLKGYRFSFGPKRDKTANAIDLSLDFFKNGNESKVTIK